MIIAIDFDGTIAEKDTADSLMDIGDPLPYAIETIKLLAEKHTLILWTCRGGEVLDVAVKWLAAHEIHFDAVNKNIHPLRDGYLPRKVFAHVYIDDRNFGGFPGWATIRKQFLELEGA